MSLLLKLFHGKRSGESAGIGNGDAVVEDAHLDVAQPAVVAMDQRIDDGLFQRRERILPYFAASEFFHAFSAFSAFSALGALGASPPREGDVVAHLKILTKLAHDGFHLLEERAVEPLVVDKW